MIKFLMPNKRTPQRASYVLVVLPVVTYVYMMLIKPWFDGDWHWKYVHDVWAYWQTFNAAMIAFLASLLAIYAARYHENQSRLRQLLAARAMLPQAVSDLTKHIENITKFYSETYEYWGINERDRNLNDIKKPSHPPHIPENIAATFSNCMVVINNPENLEFMANILSMNQYITARAENEFTDIHLIRKELWKQNIDQQLLEIAEMYGYASRLFDYGRELDTELDVTKIKLEEVKNSLSVLGIREFNHPNTYQMMTNKYMTQ